MYSGFVANLSLSELLGAPVLDSTGAVAGRVRELAMIPHEDTQHIAAFVVRTQAGDRLLNRKEIQSLDGRSLRANDLANSWQPFSRDHSEGYLLLERDLLDQQIIDVHGRKVVRVNDVDLSPVTVNHHLALKVSGVDVGARGAMRRLLKNLVPGAALHALLQKIPPRIIPWEFVDLIETDPARRVKLRIEHTRLSKLHPADIADIVEDLAPPEREAVFETLNEEVAAHALEEVDPRLQVSIVESLDSDRAADIVEAMDPDAAADLLGDLSEESSTGILKEMEPEERQDVEGLLVHAENTAAGRMTTDFLSFSLEATVADAIEALREFDGAKETLNSLFLVNLDEKLVSAVPLSSLVLADAETRLYSLATDPVISCHSDTSDMEVAELFDKYNLLILPVVEKDGTLSGVITADDVISLLRSQL
jgi:magnesium transporter